MIETSLLNPHNGSIFSDDEFSLHHGRRIFFISLLFGRNELFKISSIHGLFATVIVEQVEILAALKNDVLLVHAVAQGLGILIETGSHHALGLDVIAKTCRRTGHIEAVHRHFAPVDIDVGTFLLAGDGEHRQGSH